MTCCECKEGYAPIWPLREQVTHLWRSLSFCFFMDSALVLWDECSTSKEGEVLPTVSGGEPCARGVLGPDVDTGVETYNTRNFVVQRGVKL